MNVCLTKTINVNSDPLVILQALRHLPGAFLLESSYFDPSRGRHSFIGIDPYFTFRSQGINTVDALKRHAQPFLNNEQQSLTPLSSGIVGYLSYNYGLYQEKISSQAVNDLALPDGCFGFYDVIITVDHLTQKLIITSTGLPEKNNELRKIRAQERLDFILSLLDRKDISVKPQFPIADFSPKQLMNFKSNLSKEKYISLVEKVLEYISNGDIYQLNLSQRFEAEFPKGMLDALTVYQFLRQLSPAPFSAFFDAGDHQLISSSPERFLSLTNGIVQTRPMKGTRPRGSDTIDDAKNEKELCDSVKDQAELLMITDLLRNDLGRVCEYGSIKVDAMRNIETYRNVFQATSTVEGKLRANEDAFSLLKACFPGGSITGCPKIRSMQIIDQLEPTQRGPYTGSMGYISFDGQMDLNILIRTLIVKNQHVYFQAGGGIVADSIAENEYEESLVKVRAMEAAVQLALPENILTQSKEGKSGGHIS